TETEQLDIHEARPHELPVIAAKSGPTNEQVTDDMNGMLFEDEDLDSMMMAVEVLEDEERLGEMKRNARREAMGYAWDNTSQRLIDFYMDARDRHSTGDKMV